MPPFPTLTKKWHSEPYEAIDPTRPELAVWKGKVVVITGGGGAIGSAAALAFARAGATKIAVVGRREGPLEDTKKLVEGEVEGANVMVTPADLADSSSLSHAFATVVSKYGKIDLLVANAGYLSKFDKIADADPDEWWTGFEVNAKGSFNLARAFIQNCADHAVVLNTSTCVVHMPALARASSYVSSKLASTKIWETVGAEHKNNIEVVHMHPGVVESELNIKSGITPHDSPQLPGHFAVWAVSPEAKKFRGKYLWCNWDVPELLSRQEELSQPHQLTITMNGWPFEAAAAAASDEDALAF